MAFYFEGENFRTPWMICISAFCFASWIWFEGCYIFCTGAGTEIIENRSNGHWTHVLKIVGLSKNVLGQICFIHITGLAFFQHWAVSCSISIQTECHHWALNCSERFHTIERIMYHTCETLEINLVFLTLGDCFDNNLSNTHDLKNGNAHLWKQWTHFVFKYEFSFRDWNKTSLRTIWALS